MPSILGHLELFTGLLGAICPCQTAMVRGPEVLHCDFRFPACISSTGS